MLGPNLKRAQYQANQKKIPTESIKFDGPFWIWDLEEHKKADYPDCCFNHFFGCPVKDGIARPLFPWQRTVIDALDSHNQIWIKKATGLGITELVLRYLGWLAITKPEFRNSTFCIVTGPNIMIAFDLISRLKGIFTNRIEHYPIVTIKEMAVVDNVRIQAFPSNHLDAMRAIKNVKFIFLDEADYFRKGEQNNARAVSERYIGKSDSKILMVSTPHLPGGLYERIEKESPSQYHKLELPYTLGIGNIYNDTDIERAKLTPDFQREYNLQYGYGVGNIFNQYTIESMIKKFKPSGRPFVPKSLGIDPALGGEANFAFVLTEIIDDQINILNSWSFDKYSTGEMIDFAVQLLTKYNPRAYIDDSFPNYIKDIKRRIGEHEEIHTRVQPVRFSHGGAMDLLYHMKALADEDYLSIDEAYNRKLIEQMRIARSDDAGKLDKSNHSLDLIDALMLSLTNYGEREDRR